MKKNILIIGFGRHARRIYYDLLKQNKERYDFLIVDLKSEHININDFFKNKDYLPLESFLIDFPKSPYKIRKNYAKKLNKLVKKYSIRGVIISTEPKYHVIYARWALKNNISILMDKPISAHKNMSTKISQAKKLLEDYRILERLYKKRKGILFSIVSQRRFHSGFQKVRELIKEVYEKTKCPITSIQICHSDGQWRFPSEIIDINYHSYNQGYGKCSHSGYHFLDILQFLIGVSDNDDKTIDNIEVISNFSRPLDFLSQISLSDYKNIFPSFDKYNKYSWEDYKKIMKNYGEIDAFIDINLRKKKRIITLCSLNLLHNSFSQRGKLLPNKDLYKGNGRIRHESYIIQQGPFQCVYINSLQSKEVDEDKEPDYSIGGEYNFDIHIFRNDKLFKTWKNYENISIHDLEKNAGSGKSRGHQEEARRKATMEFLSFLENGKKNGNLSDFLSHKHSVQIMYAIYMSAIKKFKNKNPLFRMKYD